MDGNVNILFLVKNRFACWCSISFRRLHGASLTHEHNNHWPMPVVSGICFSLFFLHFILFIHKVVISSAQHFFCQEILFFAVDVGMDAADAATADCRMHTSHRIYVTIHNRNNKNNSLFAKKRNYYLFNI